MASRRKRPNSSTLRGKQSKKSRSEEQELDWGQESDDLSGAGSAAESSESELDETADEKRIRLAKQYLSKLGSEMKAEDDASDDEFDAVGSKLKNDALEASGKLYRRLAARLEGADLPASRFHRGHKLPVTCISLSWDDATLFSGSKDGSIIMWDVETGTKLCTLAGRQRDKGEKYGALRGGVGDKNTTCHTGGIRALAINTAGNLLASAGLDRVVRVWDVRRSNIAPAAAASAGKQSKRRSSAQHGALKARVNFPGHRDTVSALAFRSHSNSLYSGSYDRTIKLWNLNEMAYVETLFGHQSEVEALHSLRRERVVSCGDDRTVRLWKIPEESQLVFRGHKASIDCVSMVNETTYVTGAQDGALALWSVTKKKPTRTLQRAHAPALPEGASGTNAPWISSVAMMPSADVLASGSSDGMLRLWGVDPTTATITPVAAIPCPGFINGIAIARSGRFVVAGTGQEHRLGRWERIKASRNGIQITPLPLDA